MGILLSLGRAGTSSCIRITRRKRPRVLQIVRPDGMILKCGGPVLVRDIPEDVDVSGVGLSRGGSQHLPSDCEMKMGEIYQVLPPPRSPAVAEVKQVTRIKVVITKQQLQLLLNQQVSVEEVVARLDRKKAVGSGNRDGGDYSALAWRPSLETIAEGVD